MPEPVPIRHGRMLVSAVAAFGRIDVVVNGAGHGLFGPIEKTTDEQAGDVFDTDFFGVLNVLRASIVTETESDYNGTMGALPSSLTQVQAEKLP